MEMGFNAANETFVNMITEGIIDPTKVTFGGDHTIYELVTRLDLAQRIKFTWVEQ